jgi:hypothetical protein
MCSLRAVLTLILFSLPASLLAADASIPAPAQLEFFESKIRPLLIDHCYECHSADAKIPKGGFLLDTRDGIRRGGDSKNAAVVPGDALRSGLIEAVRWTNPQFQMPPKRKLSDQQIADLVAWINMGAPDPREAKATSDKPGLPNKDFWSFKSPVEPSLPETKSAGWERTPVDRFILATLESKGLKPSAETDRRSLIRRATFDLLGLPPTQAEVDAFVADPFPDAYERLIDRLLASPHYGERWGRYWLDLARYSDTKGYVYRGEEKNFVHSANYRDWVVRALNEDMPYDRFLKLQIAGDQLGREDGARIPEDLAAMGFITIGRRFLGVVPDIVDDRMDIVMRSTMGLTVACARCHDHKFDPIPTADYYALYGVFNGSTESTVCIDPAPRQTEAYAKFKVGFDERSKKLDDTVKAKVAELLARLRLKAGEYLAEAPKAAQLPDDLFVEILGVDDLNPAVVRQWYAYLNERGRQFDPIWAPWSELSRVPNEAMAAEAPAIVQRLLANSAHPLNSRVRLALTGAKPTSMADVAAIYGKLLVEVNAKWLEQTKDPAKAPKALADADEEALRLVLYGSETPVRVPPGSVKDIEWFFDEPTRVLFGQLQAAIDQWIIGTPGAPPHSLIVVDRPEQKNPRIFKRGNASAPGEEVSRHFLSLIAGENPPAFKTGSGRLEMANAIASKENPLTARVMVNRIWAQHFGVGLVSTLSDFGTRSEPPSHPELLDWLAVQFMKDGWSIKSIHRLIMRSAAYRQISGYKPESAAVDPENRLLWRMNVRRLDFEGMRDSLLAATGGLDFAVGGKPVDFNGNRRSIYLLVDRQFVPGVFRTFDFASPDLHIPQRGVTTIPQQALFFLNGKLVSDRARALAKSDALKGAVDDEARVRKLYRMLYQREPTAGQLSAGLAFVHENATRPAEPPPAPIVSAWQYGYASYDSSADRMAGFTPLPHYTGEAWQGGATWPDSKLGWVQLTATGGHAGNDLAHATVRRWVAPRDVSIRIDGTAQHDYDATDGIAARMISSRHGTLGRWPLKKAKAETNVARLDLKRGDTVDFVVDVVADLNSDMFTWTPIIQALDAPPGTTLPVKWNAQQEFTGPPPAPPEPMDAWAMYAQVLLLSNEFVFVD